MFRAVLAGCGGMAKGWLKALAESPELTGRVVIVGLVDLDLSAAERLRAEFGLDAATGTDLEAMLSATEPDLLFDVVVPSARRAVVLAGLAHGCHVLTEKPMAASIEEARELVAAADKAGRVHAVVQNRRYIEGVRRIRAAIESGALGELTALHADFFIGAHFGGFREQMQNVLLLDMAIHTIDAARFMSGCDPLAVYCHEPIRAAPGMRTARPPMRSSNFPTMSCSPIAAPGSPKAAPPAGKAPGASSAPRERCSGMAPSASSSSRSADNSGFLRPLKDATVPPPPHPSQTHGHASVIAEFLDAIEQGRAPETAGTDNIKSLAMVFAAIESARTRQRVTIAA